MKAKDYFHLKPENWNCAQAIHKSLQATSGLSDEDIEQAYRSMGGGRAPGGMCGAIYAACTLAGDDEALKERLTANFLERTGALTCRELKGTLKRPCSWLVEQAEELLLEELGSTEEG